jgi:hypothetical protein
MEQSSYDLKSIDFIYPNYKELENICQDVENYELKNTRETFLQFARFYQRNKTSMKVNESIDGDYFSKYLLCLYLYKKDCFEFQKKINYLYLKLQVEPMDKYNLFCLYTEYLDFFDADEFTFWEMLAEVKTKDTVSSCSSYLFYKFILNFSFFKTIELNVKIIFYLTENVYNADYKDDNIYCDAFIDFQKRVNFLEKQKCDIFLNLYDISFAYSPKIIFVPYKSEHKKIFEDINTLLEDHKYDFDIDPYNFKQFTNPKIEFTQVSQFKKIIEEEITVYANLCKIKTILRKTKDTNTKHFSETQKKIFADFLELLTYFSELYI